jgi:AraC family transcriptional regulator
MPAASDNGFSAVVARTSTAHTSMDPRAYDYAEVAVIRSGSAILFGEFGQRHLNVGDVILLAPCTLYGMEPEGWITATTLYLDRDFLVDQVFWQHAADFTDRFDAQRFVDTHFADPAQVLRLGQDRAGLLMPWLDELVALSIDGPPPERYYRAQSLLFAVFDVLAPYLAVTDTAGPRGRSTVRPTVPRHRPFAPVRDEARHAAEVLRASLHERWTLDRLAETVHLSSSQVGRVFTEAFGKTPIAYLTMLRAERMAHLLRTTNEPIAAVARAVGWVDPDYAGRLFRRSIGFTPRQYRTLSRRVPAADGAGGFPR